MTNVDWLAIHAYLSELSSHGVYKVGGIADRLSALGLPSVGLPSNVGIDICGRRLMCQTPDFGQPGVWSIDVAECLLELLTGQDYVSPYGGRGWRYRDVLAQIEKHAQQLKAR
jgi:hypothetical protein